MANNHIFIYSATQFNSVFWTAIQQWSKHIKASLFSSWLVEYEGFFSRKQGMMGRGGCGASISSEARQQGERGLFEMQRGLIRSTMEWADRAGDLFQKVEPDAHWGTEGPARSCSACCAIEPGGRGLPGERGGVGGGPRCEAVGGILIPYYLDKRLKDSCFISPHVPLLLAVPGWRQFEHRFYF